MELSSGPACNFGVQRRILGSNEEVPTFLKMDCLFGFLDCYTV